jgi:hypothetical protein
MMRRLAAAFFVMSFAQPALADWSCANDFEINCSDGTCTVAEDFTPMAILLGGDGLQVCAYSLCIADPAPVLITAGGHEIAVSDRMINDMSEDGAAQSALLAIDRATGAGVVRGLGFDLPVTCVAASANEGG